MFKKLLAAATLAFAGQALAAPVYNFTDNNANTGGAADYLDSLSATWDAGNQILNWTSTFNTSAVDSFWLVVNDGPNPKVVDTNELVIFYGDLVGGKVYSYVYNGANNARSYRNPGILLQVDDLNVVGNSIDFTIDATEINSAATRAEVGSEFRGIVAGPEKLGAWYHVATGSQFGFDDDGLISSYSFARQGYYDRANLHLQKVPEPGSMALLGLGLLSLGMLRRNRGR